MRRVHTLQRIPLASSVSCLHEYCPLDIYTRELRSNSTPHSRYGADPKAPLHHIRTLKPLRLTVNSKAILCPDEITNKQLKSRPTLPASVSLCLATLYKITHTTTCIPASWPAVHTEHKCSTRCRTRFGSEEPSADETPHYENHE